NLAWCHPVVYQRLEAAKSARPSMKIIVVDPRRTATCEFADIHLALKPGSDVALFQGLLNALRIRGALHHDFVENHTNNVDEALNAAEIYDLQKTSAATGIPSKMLSAFFDEFAKTQKTVTVYSQGVNQAVDGTDRVNAIINCHLLTGRIGKPGMGPFSITGQPNAMGGREVGGLANQLACHMDLDREEHRALVQSFWRSPVIAHKPGLKAVELFEAIHDGAVKAVWIMATNPVVSMPNADRVREALKRCELTVVSDVVASSDTARCADVLLPSTAWGEKNGMVTNSERRMSRQRAFLDAPGQARHDWQQICDVATQMGWADAFAFDSPDAIYREYAALSGYDNNGARDLDLSETQTISPQDYEEFTPKQWPLRRKEGGDSERLFTDNRFYTHNGRANFVPIVAAQTSSKCPDFPFVLNTGRVRDQWHTMTRTGRSARLSQHIAEPYVEVAPDNAESLGLRHADLARIKSPQGEMIARVLVTDRQQTGSVFVPMHWSSAFASSGRVDALTEPKTDPISGQPALKSSSVRISRFDPSWYGFGVIAANPRAISDSLDTVEYWVSARITGGVRIEMAGATPALGFQHFADSYFSRLDARTYTRLEVLHYENVGSGDYRYAVFCDGSLLGALYISKTPVLVARAWVCEQLNAPFDSQRRSEILAARASAGRGDRGPIVCACMNVGANEIAAAMHGGCRSVDAISNQTGAGSNCGSCRSEIRRLISEPLDA
ncbi:MAG: molybdopterin-dependent oxidoreductase, partial [Pseudomonadota bacterium]